MSGAELGLALSVFLACAVEAVEALTIVMAVGHTRSWSSALAGAGAAAIALAAAIARARRRARAGCRSTRCASSSGRCCCSFGLQWLRKAILRAAGLKALHDERSAYEHEQRRRAGGGRAGGAAGTATRSRSPSKASCIEGLEVAIIVITFGANRHHVGLAAAAAGVAVLLVIAAGVRCARRSRGCPRTR